MSLSGQERRALRDIERALRAEEPALAGLLTAPIDPETRFVRRLAGAFVAVAVALIVGGLLLIDHGMIVGGCLVLITMSPTVWLVAAARRRGT